jgi:serine/threonine-protein kinase
LVTRRTEISALSGAAAGAAATGVFAISRYRGAAPRKLTQFAIASPNGEPFVPSFNRRVGISPDGTLIAFNTVVAGVGELFYLRSLNELESKRVKDITSGGAAFFSPDGRWVGFITINIPPLEIRKLAVTSRTSVTVCPHGSGGPSGFTWADDDTIYWVDENPGGLMSIPSVGGQPREVFKIDFANGERQHKYPCALPGAKAVLATVTTADTATFDQARVVAFLPRTGQRKVLLEGGTHPRYSSGHLFYGHDGKILAVRFDPGRLELQGQPFTVLEGLQR